jgi:uncharacterized membrane protein YdjX (TVP38/TMEM64 family)
MTFTHRVKGKVIGIAPIVIGAVIVALLFSALIYAIKLGFPEHYNQTIGLISDGDFNTKKDSLKAFFLSYGDLSEIVFLGVQLAQVLFAPIPGQLTGLLGGFVFGFWKGLFLTMVGLAIGSYIAIGFSRIIGDVFVRKYVPEKILIKFDFLLLKGSLFDFFMIFLLPAFPDDAICFIAGLTRIKVWKLMLVCVIGRFPGMAVLTFAGSSINTNIFIAQIVFGVAMVAAVVIWLYEDKVSGLLKPTK